MRFTLMFKTNDVLSQIDNMQDDDRLECQMFAEKYVKWGEYITVEFDTEAGTAVALNK